MSPPFDLVESAEDVKEYQPRYTYLYGAVFLTFLVLVFRLWFLQIIKGAEFQKFSEQNQIKEEKNPAPRGMIFDRNGEILVDNLPSFNVTLTPQYIVSLDKIADELSIVLKIKKDDIIDKVKQSRRQNGVFKPVRVKENVNRDEVAAIERMVIDNPGLKVEMGIKRNFLLDENGAQVFGYVAEISKDELPIVNANRPLDSKLRPGDVIGKAGIEKRWDSDLRGTDGARFVEVDARGREIASGKDLILGGYPDGTDYSAGHNMTLTIDRDIQKTAFESFQKAKQIGSAIVLDPNDGEVLAMLNMPSFDPNHFSTGIPADVWAQLVNDPNKPMRNKVVQDWYSPGSTFKAIVALAALEEKAITPQTTFFCPGYLAFGKRRYSCWNHKGHGYVNVVQAIEESCDVFFYQVGLKVGMDKIAKYARALGLGAKTGILLDNERTGVVPDSEWKMKMMGEEWQPGETLSNAIGQGFNLVSPLQLAVAYGAIATEGKVYRPYIIKKIESIDGKSKKEFSPILIRDIQEDKDDEVTISPKNLALVKKGLENVFDGAHGTGHYYHIPGLEMAGKTGTVQLFQLSGKYKGAKCPSLPFKLRDHGWMAAFAPADHPKIAMAVLTEHSCHGPAAGPIIKDIMMAYFKKYDPDMIKHLDVKLKPLPSRTEEGAD